MAKPKLQRSLVALMMIFSCPFLTFSGPYLEIPHLEARMTTSKTSTLHETRAASSRTSSSFSGPCRDMTHFKPPRIFRVAPSNPKWTWPISLMILSLSASNLQSSSRLSSTKLQAFAGGLEGCDYHGAGRYEFETRRATVEVFSRSWI